jgi:hypothetical protein
MRELTRGLMSWPTRVQAEDLTGDLTISSGSYADLVGALVCCLDELERLYALAEPADSARERYSDDERGCRRQSTNL